MSEALTPAANRIECTDVFPIDRLPEHVREVFEDVFPKAELRTDPSGRYAELYEATVDGTGHEPQPFTRAKCAECYLPLGAVLAVLRRAYSERLDKAFAASSATVMADPLKPKAANDNKMLSKAVAAVVVSRPAEVREGGYGSDRDISAPAIVTTEDDDTEGESKPVQAQQILEALIGAGGLERVTAYLQQVLNVSPGKAEDMARRLIGTLSKAKVNETENTVIMQTEQGIQVKVMMNQLQNEQEASAALLFAAVSTDLETEVELAAGPEVEAAVEVEPTPEAEAEADKGIEAA